MPFTRKTTRTYRPETFYRHFNDARALQTYTHDAHARKTHTKPAPWQVAPHCDHFRFPTRTVLRPTAPTHGPPFVPNQHRTVHRHHLHPNPHCSPTNRTDPWATLHPKPTSHCSPKFGLCRFFNIFLQNPYLLTCLIWRGVKTPSILLSCPWYHLCGCRPRDIVCVAVASVISPVWLWSPWYSLCGCHFRDIVCVAVVPVISCVAVISVISPV